MSTLENKPSNNNSISKNLSFLFSFYSDYKKDFFWAFFFFAIKRGVMQLPTIAIMLIIDNFIPAKAIDKTFSLIAVVSLSLILNIIYHRSYMLLVQAQIIKNVSRDLRNKIVHKLQLLSIGFHRHNHSGKLFSKIMVDVDKIDAFGIQFVNNILGITIDLLFSITILIAISLKFFGIFLIMIPAYLILYKLFIDKMNKLQREVRSANEALNTELISYVDTQYISRIHGETKFEFDRVEHKAKFEISKVVNLRFVEAFFGSSNSCVAALMKLFIAAVCAMGVIDNSLSLGELFIFVQLTTLFLSNLQNVINVFPLLTEFSESVNSIGEILDSSDEEKNIGKLQINDLKGEIEFTNVSFHYNSQKPIFNDLSCRIKKGTTVALVGSSGSGKSTFVNLVLGLIRPTNGTIKIDNKMIKDLDMRSVRKQVAAVTQDPIIFSGTIRENISYARNNIPDGEVLAAAKIANAYDFIMELPEAFETKVGDKGVTLSGGQKQRIAIARAILRTPGILILDEATSALDSKSEDAIQKAILSLQGKQTTLIIAHRLSTIFHADTIYVFNEGGIVEEGTHNSLIDKKGIYAHLLSIQLGVSIDNLEKIKNG